jgi:hypothetical protein
MWRGKGPRLVSQFKERIILSHYATSSVNVAWPHGGMGDAEYLYAFQRIIMPIAMEFSPDLVISKFIRYSGTHPHFIMKYRPVLMPPREMSLGSAK